MEDAATLERPKVPSAVAIWSIVLHIELRVGASEVTSAYQKDLGKASLQGEIQCSGRRPLHWIEPCLAAQ